MKKIFTLLLLCGVTTAHAQEDDWGSEDDWDNDTKHSSEPAFYGLKINNLQSTTVAGKKDFSMFVSHRFGTLKDGISTFFGLDNANTKIDLSYGLMDGLQLGISRESLRKTYAMYGKARLMTQSEKMPVNLSAYFTTNVNSELSEERYPNMVFWDRFSYASQLLVSRRFNNWLSVQIAPTFVRQNLVWEHFQDHNQMVLAGGARFGVTKKMSINVDYSYNMSRAEESVFKNPLSLGLEIKTFAHVFQMLFSNAQSSNEPGFMTNAEGDWSSGDIFFGFNIVRDF